MRIMVTGSRKWTDEQAIRMALFPWFFMDEDITLVHGGAEGADQQAEKAAKVLEQLVNSHPYNGDVTLKVEVIRPQYRKGDYDWNKWAPKKRNLDMLDTKPDVVLAFKLGYGRTGGTQFTIEHAQRRGIPVWVVNHPEVEEVGETD